MNGMKDASTRNTPSERIERMERRQRMIEMRVARTATSKGSSWIPWCIAVILGVAATIVVVTLIRNSRIDPISKLDPNILNATPSLPVELSDAAAAKNAAPSTAAKSAESVQAPQNTSKVATREPVVEVKHSQKKDVESETPVNIGEKAEENIKPQRAVFGSRGLSSLADYVSGPEGHWARSENVWLTEVVDFIPNSNGRGYRLQVRKIEALKNPNAEEGDTLYMACKDPEIEYKMPRDQARGRKLVVFFNESMSFFVLTAGDYQKIIEK